MIRKKYFITLMFFAITQCISSTYAITEKQKAWLAIGSGLALITAGGAGSIYLGSLELELAEFATLYDVIFACNVDNVKKLKSLPNTQYSKFHATLRNWGQAKSVQEHNKLIESEVSLKDYADGALQNTALFRSPWISRIAPLLCTGSGVALLVYGIRELQAIKESNSEKDPTPQENPDPETEMN